MKIEKDSEVEVKFGSKDGKDQESKNGKKGKGKGKGKGGKGRGHGRWPGKGSKSNQIGKQFNDISWYTSNKIILDAFAKLPYSFISGANLPGVPNNRTVNIATVISYIVDWVANDKSRFKITDEEFPAINVDGQSVMDQVKTILYSEMRRVNAGSTNQIQPIDVFTSNLLASIDVVCNSVYIARVFKIANNFSWQNRSIPEEFFTHMGIQYNDFIANQANYRGRFDTLVAYAKTIRTLSKYPFVHAAFSEYMNIFKDEDTTTGREQYILPVKAFHHIYDPIGTDEHPGGSVRLMNWKDLDPTSLRDDVICTCGRANGLTTLAGGNKLKFSVLLDILECQIAALVEDADFNLIQADLEKAFGDQGGYFEAAPVDAGGDPLVPICSGEFNAFFRNATFLQLPGHMENPSTPDDAYWVVPKNEYINTISQQQVNADESNPIGAKFIFATGVCYPDDTEAQTCVSQYLCHGSQYSFGFVNSDTDDPSSEDNVMYTRYKTQLYRVEKSKLPNDFKVAGSANVQFFTYGTSNFIIFGGMVTSVRYSYNGNTQKIRKSWSNVKIDKYEMTSMENYTPFSNLKNPPMWIIYNAGNYYPLGEINNIRMFNSTEIENINKTCFLALWNLPDKIKI